MPKSPFTAASSAATAAVAAAAVATRLYRVSKNAHQMYHYPCGVCRRKRYLLDSKTKGFGNCKHTKLKG